MHIHHIIPEAEDGPGTYENGIPVCLDCHAEIESRSNMGRRFTPEELRQHRNRWFQTIRERPEVLIRAAHTQTETGPLEALLAELDYNRVAVSGSPTEGFPPLATDQFQRAIATNTLAALPEDVRLRVQQIYVLINRVNYHFEEMARMDRSGGSGGAFGATQAERNKLRGMLNQNIPQAVAALEGALGRAE